MCDSAFSASAPWLSRPNYWPTQFLAMSGRLSVSLVATCTWCVIFLWLFPRFSSHLCFRQFDYTGNSFKMLDEILICSWAIVPSMCLIASQNVPSMLLWSTPLILPRVTSENIYEAGRNDGHISHFFHPFLFCFSLNGSLFILNYLCWNVRLSCDPSLMT